MSNTTLGAYMLLGGVTVVGMSPVIDAGVLIAAVSGSLIFVLVDNAISNWKKIFLFIPSVVSGVVAAPLASELLTKYTADGIEAKLPIGALVASMVVNLLVKIAITVADDPMSFIRMVLNFIRPGGGNAK
ncbi:phage holin family protein [Scandinavium sp. H11S7]|uniref:Phage holin family protein n=1 Tax=Scandinavium hiltneri TaxID=2926519 RepID=A0ABT2E531_9ENTR|nr:phage holin family protein [Scandinavium hiltneri]MCS2162982.1 phage holin family protein [Scandinavium hiltneri]